MRAGLTTHTPWEQLAERFAAHVRAQTREWISPEERHFDHTLSFAIGRLTEGQGIGQFLLDRLAVRPLRCLDVGAGGGGVALGLSNYCEIDVHTVDLFLNRDLRELHRDMGLPMKISVGSGEQLPFADASFDAVLCLETIEHVRVPVDLGSEIMRVLKPGGLCMITTPPRLRYLFKPDPHFGVRGLLLLPDRLQPWLAKRVAAVTVYDVEHIFWTVDEITRAFPDVDDRQVYWNLPRPFRSKFMNDLWWRYRFWLWDRIVLRRLKT